MIEDNDISHLSPLGSSDHEVLMWNVICYLDDNNDNPERKIWNYSNTDVTTMNNFLADVDWDNILSSDNVNNNWVTFKNIILDGQHKFVSLQSKKSNNKPPWLKENIHKEIKNKQVAYKQYLRTKSDIDLHNHQVQRNKTKDVIRKAKTDHESSIIADLKSNP